MVSANGALEFKEYVTAQLAAVETFPDGDGAMWVFLTPTLDKVKLFAPVECRNGEKAGDTLTFRPGFTRRGGLKVVEVKAAKVTAAA